MKVEKKEVERLVTRALQKKEEDKLTLEGMRDKMSQVNEFEAKLKASKEEVQTLWAELLQVREQLADKGSELSNKENELASKELVLKKGELEKARVEIAESTKKINETREAVSGLRTALDLFEETCKYLMSTGVREIMDKIFVSDELEFLYGRSGTKI